MAKKKSARKNGKRKSQKKSSGSGIVPVLLLLLLIAVVAILLSRESEEPLVDSTYASALQTFRTIGVSPVIIEDLAKDFSSGEYTIEELEEKYPGFEEDIAKANAALGESSDEIVAVVNGEEIARAELNTQKALLPTQYQDVLTDEQILEQMINEKVIVQEAARLGLSPSEEELEEGFQGILNSGALTQEELELNLASYGLTTEDLRAMLQRQLTINKVVEAQVQPAPVSKEEAEAYYNENSNSFATEEQVTVRHILIPKEDDPDAAQVEAEKVLMLYNEGTDFCNLVTDFSKDLGSTGNCGEYTFGRGFMVPEFEEASFRLKDTETEIVQTQFGSHVVLKMSSTAGRTLPFEEVQESIVTRLQDEAQVAAFQAFIQELLDTATIENFITGETSEGNGMTGNVVAEPEVEIVEVVEEETAEIEEVMEEEAMEHESTEVTVEIVAPAEPAMESEPEEVMEEVETTAEVVPEESMMEPDVVTTGAASNDPSCTAEPDAGNCFTKVEKYFFNQETGMCESFDWSGCGGTIPFHNLRKCQQTCEAPAEEPAEEVVQVVAPTVEQPEYVAPEPVTVTPNTPAPASIADLEGFAECLTSRDVILYTAPWSTVGREELLKFGDNARKLANVDCGEYENICDEAGVEAYPTWSIGGKLFPGRMGFVELSAFSGCPLPEQI